MDRDRLKEVHQTDLTESRLNEDFVDWLKTKGPTWLLVCLVAITAFIGIVRFRQHKTSYREEAWSAFLQAELPGSLSDVAREYGDVDQIANLSRLQAADQYLRAVQSGRTLEGMQSVQPPGAPPAQQPAEPSQEELLGEEGRTEYLERAEIYYQQVVENDNGSLGLTVQVVNALNGLAAVAEARGNAEAAKKHYLAAAERAEEFYAGLSRQSRQRAESVGRAIEPITLPTNPTFARNIPPRALRGGDIEEALRDLLLPEEGEE